MENRRTRNEHYVSKKTGKNVEGYNLYLTQEVDDKNLMGVRCYSEWLSLQKFLPQELNDNWKELSFGKIDSCINQEHISVLTQPCAHLVSLGGKRWRPLLLVLCAQMTAQAKKTDVDLTKAYGLTPLVEFAHTASLIHDDIEDGADTRRGKPCAHISYGMDVAINAGSCLYLEA